MTGQSSVAASLPAARAPCTSTATNALVLDAHLALGGKQITTIEAMESDRVGKVVQDAWVRNDVVQCGYANPGRSWQQPRF